MSDLKPKQLAKEFPVAITLRFRGNEERDYFMGQLSDGWGENHVDLSRDWSKDFTECELFGVDLGPDDRELLDHHRAMRKKYGG